MGYASWAEFARCDPGHVVGCASSCAGSFLSRAVSPLEENMAHAEKIMVIRHGEKPQGALPPYGVTTDGEQDVNSLLVTGWTRAGALAVLFAPSRGSLQSPELAHPQTLFPAAATTGKPSKRLFE